MDARQFVTRVREEVLERNLKTYKEQLATSHEKVSDPQWAAIVAAYERMDDAQRAAVTILVRQVIVDTISNIFGIIDGSTLLSDFRERFMLEYGFKRDKLSGDLQDILLADES